MKKGNKKSSIIDRAKSNVEKNRKEQKVENFFKKFKKYINTFNGRFILLFLLTVAGFTMLLGRVYHLQTKGGKKYREDAEKKYSSEEGKYQQVMDRFWRMTMSSLWSYWIRH